MVRGTRTMAWNNLHLLQMCKIHYMHCPVCGSANIANKLQARDHTVSNELFWIAECKDCSLRFTQDVPDDAEIAPYYKSDEYISHSDTKKGLINSLYHLVRKRTLKQKRKLVQKATGIDKGSLLDIGSGTGAFVHEMKNNGWEITGLEPDYGARLMAKESYNIELNESGLLYRLPDSGYDAITLWHVLEHVHDLQGYIQKLKAVLKPDGRIIIAVPNYTSLDESVYQAWWAAYDVPRHLYHFSPKSLKTLMEKNGLKIIQYKPLWFDSFYISLLSSKYKKGKAQVIPAFLNGLRSNMKAIRDVKKCSSVIYIIGK
jgi:2-polyprenyl-3-methyl-5-hydroxy-6-metoxy-1,4-benzoquinol methylase